MQGMHLSPVATEFAQLDQFGLNPRTFESPIWSDDDRKKLEFWAYGNAYVKKYIVPNLVCKVDEKNQWLPNTCCTMQNAAVQSHPTHSDMPRGTRTRFTELFWLLWSLLDVSHNAGLQIGDHEAKIWLNISDQEFNV